MITSVKKFGSYVLVKNTLYASDIQDDINESKYVSSCSIPSHWIDLPLLKILPYNHDTSIFRFALPEGAKELRLPIGAYLFILAPGCEHDGTDAIRPYTSITVDTIQNHPLHPYESVPSFDILCKRYDEWGVKENSTMNFLFTKTDHSYRPAGAVSNYLHKLKVGDKVKFKHNRHCLGKIPYPFPGIRKLMMIAVGVGVAPMIQMLNHLLKQYDTELGDGNDPSTMSKTERIELHDIEINLDLKQENAHPNHQIEKIVLFYGVRTVQDILLREQLEQWQSHYANYLQIIFCIGSRWNNIHFGAKKKEEYVPPPLPTGFETLSHAELGWINEEKISKYGLSPGNDTKVLVCGLPAVYDHLCGKRDDTALSPTSILARLGYTAEMVIKL